MAFADIQSAVPKLGLDDVGDRWRHAVAHHIPSALQVAAKAFLFLDRQTEPQFVGRLTEAIDSGSPLGTSTNCGAQSAEIRDTGSRNIRWGCTRNHRCVIAKPIPEDAVTEHGNDPATMPALTQTPQA